MRIASGARFRVKENLGLMCDAARAETVEGRGAE
jgi:hypothetical protein